MSTFPPPQMQDQALSSCELRHVGPWSLSVLWQSRDTAFTSQTALSSKHDSFYTRTMFVGPSNLLMPLSPESLLSSGSGSNVLQPLGIGKAALVPHAGTEGLPLPAGVWHSGRIARPQCNLIEQGRHLDLEAQGLLEEREPKTPSSQPQCMEIVRRPFT